MSTAYDAVAQLYKAALVNASPYDPYLLGIRSALCTIAEKRFEVQPATLAGQPAAGHNVIDTWTGDSLEHHSTAHKAATRATQLNRNSGATCIDHLTTEVAA